MNDAFLNTEVGRTARVFPKNVAKVLVAAIKRRTFKDQSPILYTDSGEPIHELNKMFTVGDPTSSTEAAAAVQRNPSSERMTVDEAIASGFSVPSHDVGGETKWVVVEPKPVSVEQYEEFIEGVHNAANAAQVRGRSDRLHAEIQRAAMEDRSQVPWPAELGPKPEIHRTLEGDRGSKTISGWAAVQQRKHELMKDLERDLFNMNTDRAQATNDTTGARALTSLGEPGTDKAERAVSKLTVNEPGGRQALDDVLATNFIEGNSGLRGKTKFTGFNPLSAHNREAAALRLDPTMQTLGRVLPRVGAAAPEDDKAVIKRLLSGFMP
jgi:hypothetical protein